MVMDIRDLRGADGQEPPPAPAGRPQDLPDLEALLSALVEADGYARLETVDTLRALVPSDEGVETLCRIVETAQDPRRLAAVQVLGRHRQWLSSRAQLERVVGWARTETDPEVAPALAWLLRGRPSLQAFLLHPIEAMSREAALGLPLGADTVVALLDALLVGRSPEVDRILAAKLRTLPGGLTPVATDHLLAVADQVATEALEHVVAGLPQRPAFERFVEGRGRPAWSAQPSRAETERSQRWHRVARLVTGALLASPSAELIRYLVNRSAADDTFARRHGDFMKKAMANTREVFGPEMVDDLERLTVHATDDRLERMARMLMDLGDKIAGGETHLQIADLLERWKRRSPALKLRIFHLQQGLK